YGRSKLGGEQEVRERCQSPFTILRPPAVFGPRDTEFLSTFRAVKRHLSPGFIGGVDTMSIVFVKDLAEAVATCLTHHAAVGRTYFVASPDVVTVCGLGDEIAKQLNVWTLPLWLPVGLLWPVCAINEVLCRLVNKPSMLNRQKYRELSAPGWVCDTTRLKAEVGFVAPTPLPVAIQQTIGWYREKEML
ncbi:MAG TPA: sugar nucleotide-binding protein, partial [Verrucomicrobiota bacterium]|nr:sugar nucleotide-binding protein [Verrucomicrobiota bacterium]